MPQDSIVALYGLPLDAFITERNALAKRLSKEGQAEQAEAVRALKKPALPVWAVNQLARQARGSVEALIVATDLLRGAQIQGSESLREATRTHHRALHDLRDRLDEILRGAGHAASAATIDKAGGLLRAAAIDVEARQDLLRGALTDELEARGFDELGGVVVSVRARPPPTATSTPNHDANNDSAALTQRRRQDAELERARQAKRDEMRNELVDLEVQESARAEESMAANRQLEQAEAALQSARRSAERAQARAAAAQEMTRDLRQRLAQI